jgi:hypothetical protein
MEIKSTSSAIIHKKQLSFVFLCLATVQNKTHQLAFPLKSKKKVS